MSAYNQAGRPAESPAKDELGYAIVLRGKIVVETVSPTPIAAKVNFIMTHIGVALPNFTTDDDINRVFRKIVTGFDLDCRCVAVSITEKRYRDDDVPLDIPTE